MSLDAIRNFFQRRPPAGDASVTSASSPSSAPEAEAEVNPLHVAACALLLDIAWADGEFSEAERAHLTGAIQRHFALDPDAGARLLALAEEEHSGSIDQFRFTAMLREQYDIGQKMVLAEIMWGIVLSDGVIAEHEAYLTRKISNLLDLAPGYLSAARASAEGTR